MKFKVGDLVTHKESIRPHSSYTVDKVSAILNGFYLVEHHGFGYDGEIRVDENEYEPGSRSWRSALARYKEDELCTIEEHMVEAHKLEAEQSRLDAEFQVIRSQFQENLDKAADLINQSTTMAEACQKDIRESLKNDFRNLFHALDKAGWSASFTRC